MTAPSKRSSVISGADDAPTPTLSNAILTPTQFAEECRRIVADLSGHAAHCELDATVTRLLSNLGYSEGMAVFSAGVRGAHGSDPA